METISIYLGSWWNDFLVSATLLWNGLAASFAPILGAALILLVGWFLAIFLGRLIRKILGEDNIHWDKVLSSIGLSHILEERLGLSSDVGAFLGWLVKWFLIIVSFMAAMSVLQLQGVSVFVQMIAAFLPTAITSALIVFIGFFVGKFIDLLLTRVFAGIGVAADVAGSAARWIIVGFSILAAARFLNLELDLLWPKLVDFLVFAGAIAVGFGFSSKAQEWLANLKGRF
ncbi:MAG: hypothetical protein AAB767_00950 [Patescibacteria group bacterium]